METRPECGGIRRIAGSGQGNVIREHAPSARDWTQRKGCRYRGLTQTERSRNQIRSKVRARVEHPFLVIKRIFGFVKVRYRGLMKNTNWLFVTCGLTNLYLARRRLLSGTSERLVRTMNNAGKSGIKLRHNAFKINRSLICSLDPIVHNNLIY